MGTGIKKYYQQLYDYQAMVLRIDAQLLVS
jgi:regulation of enolase protein 1 (concanavalin A-like superfamily)